jgi:hypothetical protein
VIIDHGPHRLGKDSSGTPALLVSLPNQTEAVLPPVQLEHIAVQHGVRCRLWRDGGEPEAATVTLVRCCGADEVLRDYFLSVVEGVLPLLGAAPTEARVREVVGALIELFRALELPPRKALQGLWAELFVIAQATDAKALVQGWHVSPEEPYDFVAGVQRLEVKSTSGDERCHHFALDQLQPPAGTTTVIASVFVDAAGGGVSLGELVDRARMRVATEPELTIRLDQAVASSLGQNWRRGLGERFDLERAQESLAFFDTSGIPSIHPGHVPPGVSDVRFCARLVDAQPLVDAVMRERGGLFQAVLPVRGSVPLPG